MQKLMLIIRGIAENKFHTKIYISTTVLIISFSYFFFFVP